MAALLRASSRTVSKALGDQTRGYKVAVLGAAGGIGQPCGLLMKMVRAAIVPPFHISPKPSGDRWAIRPDLAHPTLTFLPFPPPQNPLVTELSLLARRLREGREQSPGIPEVPGERCRSELLPGSGFGGPMGKGQGMGSHPRRILAPRVHEGRMEGAEGPRLTAVHPE